MRTRIIYLTILISSVLLFSCNKEEVITPTKKGKMIEMPVSIEVSSKKADEVETRAVEPTVAGTCNVDEILLLIYSGENSVSDITQLTYTSQETLSCTKENDKWVARGTINGEAGKNYAIFALGYNKENESGNFSVTPILPTLYGETMITLNSTQYNEHIKRYRTPELFAGNVMPQNGTEVFTANGEVALTGELHRSVGKCSLTLTDIPQNITKISWLTEKISEYNLLYRDWVGKKNYPMGVPGADEQTNAISEIASIERGADNRWSTNTLVSYFIPLQESLYYADVTDDSGKTTRYQIKCADVRGLTIWLGLISYGVKDYRFTIAPNYYLSVEGPFSTLQNSGNLHLELGAMDEYNEDFLKPIP